mgnify:CR=1 FL=1
MDTILSIMVLAIVALLLGAVALWRRGVRRQAVLMTILALIAAGNVAIWLAPNEQGRALVDGQP